jgi:hypothetical protein
MNAVERVLEGELVGLLDRLAASLPQGTLVKAGASSPTLRARLDEAEAKVAEMRGALLADYGRWQRGLEDLENLWALANWRLSAQESVEETTTLVAA